MSAFTQILAATKPAKPLPPIVQMDYVHQKVKVNWFEPQNGGSPVTGYNLYVAK